MVAFPATVTVITPPHAMICVHVTAKMVVVVLTATSLLVWDIGPIVAPVIRGNIANIGWVKGIRAQ